MVDLEAEFWIAMQQALRVGASSPFSRAIHWGFATVETYGHERRLYEPQADGDLVIVAPVVEDGALIDLAAIHPETYHWSTRCGFGHGLGVDEIEAARWGSRWNDESLLIVETGIEWLRKPVGAAYLFDLRTVTLELEHVDKFDCSTRALADRVAALFPPSRRNRVGVRIA
jgi:hypothetical protein